jgi:hypothetical protein
MTLTNPTSVTGPTWLTPVNTPGHATTPNANANTGATTSTTGASSATTAPSQPLGVPQPYAPGPAAPAPAAPSGGGSSASAFGHGVALFALLAAGLAALIVSSRLVRRVLTDGSSAFVVSIVEWPG